ncbi:hypothetical protein [Wolbachia endosymbiont of Atemnus politus]|uniref:hypothetical protein n=1 Tax=Wolbachia endosymbiont of Atemnus politus TaxID=2682840 RepID=UPI0015738C67|nr:hypothetical protein [Wolbachia endosymbiont of Atemnus politus]
MPPYSLDLNPVEKFWFAIKHAIRKVLPSQILIQFCLSKIRETLHELAIRGCPETSKRL